MYLIIQYCIISYIYIYLFIYLYCIILYYIVLYYIILDYYVCIYIYSYIIVLLYYSLIRYYMRILGVVQPQRPEGLLLHGFRAKLCHGGSLEKCVETGLRYFGECGRTTEDFGLGYGADL